MNRLNASSIVMNHYVRELRHARYPGIKGLDVEGFRGQVDYLRRHYNVVTMEDVVAALNDGDPLPEKPALLTFDDGYLDHFTNVFPILHERGLQGSFFPP